MSGQIRVLIVDDEERARRTLRVLLEAEPNVVVIGESWGTETPAEIRRLAPDVVFLDVQMPGMDGFQVLQELAGEHLPVVVFVTAHEEHALEAFEHAAVDYLLKPFSDERCRTALSRARGILEHGRISALHTAVETLLQMVQPRKGREGGSGMESEILKFPAVESTSPEPLREARPTEHRNNKPLLLRDATRTHVFYPSEIDWLEAEDVYVRVHAGKRELLVRESLGNLEARLKEAGFHRIHRSALVNLSRISELRHRSHGDYQVRLKDGTELSLARSRKRSLEERLGTSLG